MRTLNRSRLVAQAIACTVALAGGAVQAAEPDRPSRAGDHPSRAFWLRVGGQLPGASSKGTPPSVRPRRFGAFHLDHPSIGGLLARAPRERTRSAREQPLVVSLPAPGGAFQRFAVQESQIMEPGLAALHPEIKTYSGRGIDDHSATIRLDMSPLGFHASVRGPQGAWYIDPYYQRDDSVYVSYYGRDAGENPHGSFTEGDAAEPSVGVDRGYYHPADVVELRGGGFAAEAAVTITIADPDGVFASRTLEVVAGADGSFDATFDADPTGALGTRRVEATNAAGSAAVTYDVVPEDSGVGDPPVGDQLRTYRLALLTDNSYAAYFGAENVTAAKVALINRVSQVYEDETSIRLVLIANNDALNLNTAAQMTGTNGPCGAAACFSTAQAASCGSATLTRNRQVIGLLVGASSFDIGHIALGVNGGGIASLGVVGGNNKAQGCTGIPTPVGDFFAVDYVAHEMGHQFAGNHPFNGTISNCSGGNRSAAASWEPGSGSSIMAYAGICGADNLQPHSDPYWSARSTDEIVTYTSGAETNISEVQMGALTGFDTNGDSFQLRFNGNDSAPIVRGTNYTLAGVKAAIEAISGWPTGGTATVSALTDTGFTVTFAGTLANTDVSLLTLVNAVGASGYVGEIARGGPTNRRGAVTPTGNNFPVVTAPASYTIPLQTPFALTGSAVDPDGDTLTYMWEQTDRGGTVGTALQNNNKTNGPLFRQFGTAAIVSASDTLLYDSPGENHVTTDPTRVFPNLAQIIANRTNAETGTCPAGDIDCFSEFLPTPSYVGFAGVNASPLSLHFRLTARDGHPNGGGVNSAATTVFLATGAGPFLVTAPNTAVTFDGGSTQTVAWSVAGTDVAPVNAAAVKISLSVDGGLTYPYTLAASTANDGAEDVVVPNVGTKSARVKVEAVDNIFFDISNSDFTIKASQTIDFPAIADHTYGEADFTVAATASSGRPVTFTASGECTITDATVHIVAAGSCSVTAHQAGNDTYYPAPDVTVTFAIGKAVLVAAPDPSTASRQYSDANPAFGVSLTGFVNGEGVDAVAILPTCSTTATAVSAPDAYPIACAGGAAANYSFSYVPGTLTVTPEDAEATYTGDMLAFTKKNGAPIAVLLRATVRDSAVVPDSGDSTLGDIRNAMVSFREGGTVLCVAPAGSLVLLAGDPGAASASCTATLALGSHEIEVVVEGYYTDVAPAVVEIIHPDGSFVTGAGFRRLGASGGVYKADARSKMSFGFHVTYANHFRTLRGRSNIVFRSGGRDYLIAEDVIDSLGIEFKNASGAPCECNGTATRRCFGIADFRGQASLIDVSRHHRPRVIGTHLTLRITATDRSAPGTHDSIGVTLWDGNTLLFSSEWTGTETLEKTIDAGRVIIH